MKRAISFALTLALGVCLGAGGLSLMARSDAAGTGKTAEPTNDSIYINGQKANVEVYKIDGSNYFKLRDLGKALDFYVGWSQEQGVYIEGDRPYEDQNGTTGAPDARTAVIPKQLMCAREDYLPEYRPAITFNPDGTCGFLINYGFEAGVIPAAYQVRQNAGTITIVCAFEQNISAFMDREIHTVYFTQRADGWEISMVQESSAGYTSAAEMLGLTASGELFIPAGAETLEVSLPSQPVDVFAELNGKSFDFSDVAGSWETALTFGPAGTFQGHYFDSDMDDAGPGYEGTIYLSDFSGSITDAVKIDDFTYSFQLKEVSLSRTPGETEISEGIQYIYPEPYGINNGDAFLLYLPGRLMSGLPEQFIRWMGTPNVWGGGDGSAFLPFWGLYNVTEQAAAFQVKLS